MNTAWNGDAANDPSEIPSSKERPGAAEIIDKMQTQSWYKGQICFKQETEEKAARRGMGLRLGAASCYLQLTIEPRDP